MKENVKLAQSLTVFPTVFLGLAWMTPMIFFTVYGVAFDASNGMLFVSYLVAFAAILFTAYSYSRMVKAFPVAGSAYTYTKKTINPKIGFLVGWALILDYLLSPIIACLTFGLYLNAQFPSIPASVWIILFNIILAVVNIVGIKSVARVSSFSVMVQILFILVFCGFVLKALFGGNGSGSLLSAIPFHNPNMSVSAVFSGAALICFCFLGFDAVTTLSEEAIQPKKTIPRAIYWIVCIAAVLYLATAYLTQITYPHFLFQNTDTASYELVKKVGGSFLSSIFTTVLIVAIFTQGVSSLTSVTRFLYALGRESVLPKKYFGYLHPRFKTPVINIVIVSLISFSALVINLNTAVNFVSFGALTAFMFVNLSVIAHFYIKKRRRSMKQTIAYLVLPLIGAGFIGWLLTQLQKETLLVGFVWVAAGFIYLLFITKVFTKPLSWLRKESVA